MRFNHVIGVCPQLAAILYKSWKDCRRVSPASTTDELIIPKVFPPATTEELIILYVGICPPTSFNRSVDNIVGICPRTSYNRRVDDIVGICLPTSYNRRVDNIVGICPPTQEFIIVYVLYPPPTEAPNKIWSYYIIKLAMYSTQEEINIFITDESFLSSYNPRNNCKNPSVHLPGELIIYSYTIRHIWALHLA